MRQNQKRTQRSAALGVVSNAAGFLCTALLVGAVGLPAAFADETGGPDQPGEFRLFDFEVSDEGNIQAFWERGVDVKTWKEEELTYQLTINVPEEFGKLVDANREAVDFVIVVRGSATALHCPSGWHWHGGFKHCHSN